MLESPHPRHRTGAHPTPRSGAGASGGGAGPGEQDVRRLVLLDAVAAGDREALGRLFDDLASPVLLLVRSLVVDVDAAESTVVATFCDVWRRAPQVAGRCSDVRAWVLRLAVERARQRS